MNRRQFLRTGTTAAVLPMPAGAVIAQGLRKSVIRINTSHPSFRLTLGGMVARFWIDLDPDTLEVGYCAMSISPHPKIRYDSTVMERLRATGLLQPEDGNHGFMPISSDFTQTGDQPRVDILTLPPKLLRELGVTEDGAGHLGQDTSWEIGVMKGRRKIVLSADNVGIQQVLADKSIGARLAGKPTLRLQPSCAA